jgi:hypothetical protein
MATPCCPKKISPYCVGMKHLTFANKGLLVGDDVADLVVEYATILAQRGSADAVTVNAFGTDGDAVTATLLLDQGAPLMTETAHNSLPEPDNVTALTYLHQRIESITAPVHAVPLPYTDDDDIDEDQATAEREWLEAQA